MSVLFRSIPCKACGQRHDLFADDFRAIISAEDPYRYRCPEAGSIEPFFPRYIPAVLSEGAYNGLGIPIEPALAIP